MILPPARWKIEQLSPKHDRSSFTCGNAPLDRYLQQRARQDAERRLSAVFVLVEAGEQSVCGFYTLSAHSLLAENLPEHLAKKMPRYPLPVTLLGRLAVSQTRQGQGLGELLLMSALERAWLGAQEVASWAVVVDAKLGARSFYLKHDFQALPSQPDRLFLPIKTIEALFDTPD